MEIGVQPWKLGREEIARKYEALLVNFPNLNIVDIDRDVARRAAQLRAQFSIKPPDALQLAASLIHGGKIFLTNDLRLKHLQSVIEILQLDDFVH